MLAKNGKLYSYVISIRNSFNALQQKKSFKYGLPFLIFMVGGSFGLQEWTKIRYKFSQVKVISREEAKKMGLEPDKKVTLEEAYEEIKKIDIDNWENKRGPRPWELQEQQKKEK